MCQKCNHREQELELIPELEYFLSTTPASQKAGPSNVPSSPFSPPSGYAPSSGYTPPVPPSPPSSPSKRRMVDPKKVSCANTDRSFPIFKILGTTDPVGLLESVVQRAVEMLTNTIEELKRVQTRIVDFKDPIGWPLMNDTFALSLAKRMQVKVTDPRSWNRKNGKAALILLWLTNIRNLLASGDLWYICIGKQAKGFCEEGTWAWVFNHENAENVKNHENFFRIHLCAQFWKPGTCDKTKRKYTPREHFEFQAQTLIHETSHIYYNTSDDPGLGAGVAECVSQFVSEANGSPLDDCFMDRCGGPLIKP
jgi:hypothetical protein